MFYHYKSLVIQKDSDEDNSDIKLILISVSGMRPIAGTENVVQMERP